MKGAIQKYFAPCNNNSQVMKHKRSRSIDVIEISSDDDFKPKVEKRKRKLRKSDGKQTKSPKLKNGHSSAAAKVTTIKTPSLLDHGVTSNKAIVELVKTEVIDLDLEPETSPKKGENVSKPFKTIKQGKLQSEDCKSIEGASITAQKNFLKMNLSQKSQSKTDNKKLGDNTGQKVGDLSNNTEKVGGNESVGKRAYYLEDFEMVVNSVQQNRDDWRLFEGEDQSCVNTFQQLHVNARKLYVRLFHRKYAWLPINKISYPEISLNPCPYLEMLASHDFLQSSMNEILSLQEILGLLSAPDVKVLAKSFRLSVQGPKPKICDAIESMCKRQKSVFTTSSGQLTSTVTKQALSLLGTCYRVNRNVKKVFNRLLLVFDVTKGTEDDTDFTISIHSSNNPQHRKHQQLSAVLMEGMGRVAYPRYEVNRPTPIFGNRDELLEYEIAYQFLIDAISASDVSQWKVADDVCTQATERTPPTPCNKQLPVFLRCFTAQAVYVKVQSLHVEILQRLKEYSRAADVLKLLLKQKICCSRKGYWYERLSLILDQYLDDVEGSIQVIQDGVVDPYVRVGHRIALGDRARKIKSSKKVEVDDVIDDVIKKTTITPPKEVTIIGRLLPKRMQTGKARFMKQNNDDGNQDILLCSVEELVLDHYKEAGYAQGLHGEGGTFSCLLCLLMWDIIFMPGVKDVFRTRYQSHPLDLYTDHFYEHRKDLIDRRLDDIISWNNDDFIVVDFISEIWNKYNGLACSGLNWERFASLEQVLSLVKCIGGEALSGILGTMVKDFRHTRSGLPDLVVWNDISYKLVEVKGPNDRLSTNQRVWIHKLMELGVDVEVCHVSAAASRKMIC